MVELYTHYISAQNSLRNAKQSVGAMFSCAFTVARPYGTTTCQSRGESPPGSPRAAEPQNPETLTGLAAQLAYMLRDTELDRNNFKGDVSK